MNTNTRFGGKNTSLIWEKYRQEKASVEEEWMYKNFRCVVLRTPNGWPCGYVGVKKNHRLAGKDYDQVGSYIDVHGGLTYGEGRLPSVKNDTDWYWYGFDCAHGFDTPQKWPISRVVEETQRLVEQLEELKNILYLDYLARAEIEKVYGEEFLWDLIKGNLPQYPSPYYNR